MQNTILNSHLWVERTNKESRTPTRDTGVGEPTETETTAFPYGSLLILDDHTEDTQ